MTNPYAGGAFYKFVKAIHALPEQEAEIVARLSLMGFDNIGHDGQRLRERIPVIIRALPSWEPQFSQQIAIAIAMLEQMGEMKRNDDQRIGT